MMRGSLQFFVGRLREIAFPQALGIRPTTRSGRCHVGETPSDGASFHEWRTSRTEL